MLKFLMLAALLQQPPQATRLFTIYVFIDVDGGGKVPVLFNGVAPKLKLTSVKTNTPYEMSFDSVPRNAEPQGINVPLNLSTTPDEYRVSVDDLPPGYAVKNITYHSHEPGLRLVNVWNQILTVSARHIDSINNSSAPAKGSPDFPIRITLSGKPAVAASTGVRVTGRSDGVGAVTVSGRPGLLFADGTFEFAGVAPGVHSIVKTVGNQPYLAHAIVRDRDVEGIVLQPVPVLPADIFTTKPLTADVTPATVSPRSSLTGRVLDESTQQPIRFATATLTGFHGLARAFASGGRDFRISDLPPGQYVLTVEATGYKTKTEQVVVRPSETPVEIKLTK